MRKIGLYLLLGLPFIAVILLVAPFAQDQAYHQFADNHSIMGIDNFHNVISNLPFLMVSVLGFITYSYSNSKENYNISWAVFLFGVFLIAPGSAYYHYNPNDSTLVWDRLPMTIAFMGLITSLFTSIFAIKNEKKNLTILILIGFYSIFHWVHFQDLRIYLYIQLETVLVLIYIACFFKHPSIKQSSLFLCAFLYFLAKACESYDALIFDSLFYSGHSIKHLLAALAIWILIKMKKDHLHE